MEDGAIAPCFPQTGWFAMTRKSSGRVFKGDTLLVSLVGVLILAGGVRLGTRWEHSDHSYPEYNYRATRQVLHAVEEASQLLEEQGTAAFEAFDGTAFKNDDFYIYVYRLEDSECLYHGGNPAIVGQAGASFSDLQGRNLHESVLQQIRNPNNPHGWVHYNWTSPGEILAEWKSSCNREAVLPDGTRLYVGGGLNWPVPEVEFARIAVKSAVDLLQREGSRGLDALRNPSGPFNFMESEVFVLGENGISILDPALRGLGSRNILEYRDASGRYPFQLLFRKLETGEAAWAPLYGRVTQSMNLQEKYLYAQKTTMDGQGVIVGMAMNKPTQIWQK
jgi:hypothetical protein